MRAWIVAAFLLVAPAAIAKEEGQPVNPVGYFEIPVTDLDRAAAFYQAAFGHVLARERIDGYDMALFPVDRDGAGASGALVKGDVYIPAKAGPILYFSVDSIDRTIERAAKAGGKTLYPRKAIGDLGFVAEIEDSEGNRIALHEAAD